MDHDADPDAAAGCDATDDAPYLLLTPGPATTSRTVREAMLRDLSTWDCDYLAIVQDVRERLCALAEPAAGRRAARTAVLMQGSGTFVVEATLGSVVPPGGKLLVAQNGAYGARMVAIAGRLGITCADLAHGETEPVDPDRVRRAVQEDPAITHVAMVHCETTTGMLNPARAVGALAAQYGRTFVLDAMSSFGGIPIELGEAGPQFLISSANKCIQGVPGFGFVIADRTRLQECAGRARSLSLDLHDQWREMEQGNGKWRFTSPTHAVLAFARALVELAEEGGVDARYRRYRENQRTLVDGMVELGFVPLLPDALQSPIITSFREPVDPPFEFGAFYGRLKRRGFVIYPGKVTDAATFRIGTIGHVFPDDIRRLLAAVAEIRR